MINNSSHNTNHTNSHSNSKLDKILNKVKTVAKANKVLEVERVVKFKLNQATLISVSSKKTILKINTMKKIYHLEIVIAIIYSS